jgi:hypothetical protein
MMLVSSEPCAAVRSLATSCVWLADLDSGPHQPAHRLGRIVCCTHGIGSLAYDQCEVGYKARVGQTVHGGRSRPHDVRVSTDGNVSVDLHAEAAACSKWARKDGRKSIHLDDIIDLEQ